jgi:hypothetical protein
MRILAILLMLAGAGLAKSKDSEVKQYNYSGMMVFRVLSTDDADYEAKLGDGKGGTVTVSDWFSFGISPIV